MTSGEDTYICFVLYTLYICKFVILMYMYSYINKLFCFSSFSCFNITGITHVLFICTLNGLDVEMAFSLFKSEITSCIILAVSCLVAYLLTVF